MTADQKASIAQGLFLIGVGLLVLTGLLALMFRSGRR